jgi:hypothetical protein
MKEVLEGTIGGLDELREAIIKKYGEPVREIEGKEYYFIFYRDELFVLRKKEYIN